MSWITEMRNPVRVAATYHGMVGTRAGRLPGYVHSGVDIGVGTGTQVYSTRTGTVAYAGVASGYGNFVVIDHGNGLYSAYAHLDSFATTNVNGTVRALQAGDSVTSDTLIGLSGNTGTVNPHLHFEIRRINGVVVTQTNAAGVASPVIIDETGAQTGWSSFGEAYRQQLRNPDGPGGQILYDPAEVVRLYGAEMSEGAASVQERFLRIDDPYGGRDPTGMGQQQWPPEHVSSTPYCFVAGTPMLMADGSERPIEQVVPGDMVAAFDGSVDRGRGPLVPRRVVRTFRKQAFVFSFLNLQVTPGHYFLTGEGSFERLDLILENDGTVVKHSGEVVRARTGFAVDSPEDKPVQVLFVDDKGQDQSMLMRGGMICDHRMHGRLRAVLTIYRAMEQRGLQLRDDGLFEAADGSAGPVMWDGVPGDHLALGSHVPFVRLLKLHRETTPLMALIGGKSVPNPLAEVVASRA